jgi:hypothetical protein
MIAEQAEVREIPSEFLEALDDFEHGRFLTMEDALAEPPPN